MGVTSGSSVAASRSAAHPTRTPGWPAGLSRGKSCLKHDRRAVTGHSAAGLLRAGGSDPPAGGAEPVSGEVSRYLTS